MGGSIFPRAQIYALGLVREGGGGIAKTVDEIKKEIKKDIDELVEKFERYEEGGFQVTEIAKFSFEAGTRLVEAVENV